ncbi:MAG: hypothetical protein ACYC9R_13225, partial [Nitrosotalea sp.]
MGDYGKIDSAMLPQAYYNQDTNHLSGYAKLGFHFNAYAAYMFTHQIGAMISVGGDLNSYDITTYNSEVAARYPKSGGTGSPPVFTAPKGYYIGQYLIGPYIYIPIDDKLGIEFSVLVGFITANYPEQDYNYGILNGSFTFKNTTGFGYRAGISIEYMLNNNIGLHFNLNYYGTSANYSSNTVSTTSSRSGATITYTDNTAKTMSI